MYDNNEIRVALRFYLLVRYFGALNSAQICFPFNRIDFGLLAHFSGAKLFYTALLFFYSLKQFGCAFLWV